MTPRQARLGSLRCLQPGTGRGNAVNPTLLEPGKPASQTLTGECRLERETLPLRLQHGEPLKRNAAGLDGDILWAKRRQALSQRVRVDGFVDLQTVRATSVAPRWTYRLRWVRPAQGRPESRLSEHRQRAACVAATGTDEPGPFDRAACEGFREPAFVDVQRRSARLRRTMTTRISSPHAHAPVRSPISRPMRL